MKRVLLLTALDNRPAGWAVEMSDETAKALADQGRVRIMPADTPLKKGNLQLYNNCTPKPESAKTITSSQAAAKILSNDSRND